MNGTEYWETFKFIIRERFLELQTFLEHLRLLGKILF